MIVAALYVEDGGTYASIENVDAWPISRDARTYSGPYPVVAHPPCQRWGRMWHGSPRRPHSFALGDDEGCFAAALAHVRCWGGVLEHPADSHAWRHFGISRPERHNGWRRDIDEYSGATCYVEQGHYGHPARKGTWLYACRTTLPELEWGPCAQRLHRITLERHGYLRARREGVLAMIGGKNKTAIRNATPPAFRDVLLFMARSAARNPVVARK